MKTAVKTNYILNLLLGKGLKFGIQGLGLFLNSMAVWILVGEKKMQRMFMHLLAFSLLCDNGFILTDILTTCYHELHIDIFALTLPWFAYPLKEIFYFANIFITVALSYERYIMIMDNSGYKAQMEVKYFRCKRLKKYVIGVLTISVLVNFLSFFTYIIRNKSVDDSDDYQSTPEKTDLRKDKTYLIWDKAIKWPLIFVITFFLLMFFNVKIYIYVKEKLTLRTILNLNGSSTDSSSAESKVRSCFSFVDKMRKLDSLSLVLFVVTGAFLFCNAWYAGEEVLQTLEVFGCDIAAVPNYLIISRFMRTLNACTNVLVYCFADKTFKKHLKKNIWHLLYLMSCSVVRCQEATKTDQSQSTDVFESKTLKTCQDLSSKLDENEIKP